MAKNDQIDEFECEPYVYPQNVLSDEHPQFGLARNSWLTGTASWAYQAATQYISGRGAHLRRAADRSVHPRRVGWFKLTRRFRGATYRIEVNNPDHVSKGCGRWWSTGGRSREPGADPGRGQDPQRSWW